MFKQEKGTLTLIAVWWLLKVAVGLWVGKSDKAGREVTTLEHKWKHERKQAMHHIQSKYDLE